MDAFFCQNYWIFRRRCLNLRNGGCASNHERMATMKIRNFVLILNYNFFLGIILIMAGCGKELQEITISIGGNEMKFDRGELRVKADTHVKLTLVNKSTLNTMKHNILIYDMQGTPRAKALDQLGAMAEKVGEAGGYLPSVPGIIASSKMSQPGETVTVEFDAPPPGEYLFMCTYQPAHYKTMNGAFIVEK